MHGASGNHVCRQVFKSLSSFIDAIHADEDLGVW